jgi:hypothetical protein
LRPWNEIIKMPLGQLPRVPLDPIVGTVAPTVINFKAAFGTYVADLLITNLDLVAALTYQFVPTGTPKTLAAGGEIAFTNLLLESVRIVGNAATGNWELLPLALPRELLYR